jgi:XTP/dITP diphosphohydrolase
MKTVYFITSNKGKFKEAQELFSKLDIKIVQKNIGYPEIQTNSLEEVASFGAKYLQEKIKGPFILEDAGLFIDELSGFPGVFSSFVFHTVGCNGILKLMENLPINKRKAMFKSVFAYSEPNKKPKFFVGECIGKISEKQVGNNGFGYDPIFIPDGQTKTFAQMETEEKNCYSHRGISLEKLLDFFKKD